MRAAPDPRLHEPDPGARGASAPAATILVAEDEGVVRGLLMRILSHEGYRVLGAASGAEAEDAVRQGPVDLLVTGLRVADMSGVDLAERLLARRPRMPVLYLSGFGEPGGEPGPGPQRPGVGLLSRPITAELLTRRVRELLSGDA